MERAEPAWLWPWLLLKQIKKIFTDILRPFHISGHSVFSLSLMQSGGRKGQHPGWLATDRAPCWGKPCTQTPSSSTSQPSWKTPEDLRDTTVYIQVDFTTCTQNRLSAYKLNAERVFHTHIFTHNKPQQWKCITHTPHTQLTWENCDFITSLS